jgi:S-adenosylmethionine hydrolase
VQHARAFAIESTSLVLERRSATFHGRDVFAPVAAHLANGRKIEEVGSAIDLDRLVRLPPDERPSIAEGQLVVRCLYVDGFGNCSLAASSEELELAGLNMEGLISIAVDGRERGAARRGRTFTDVPPGALVLYEDSRGAAALGVNGGDAARRLGLGAGDRVTLERGS